MLFIILKDIITICWCLAIDSALEVPRDVYTNILNKYHNISHSALTPGEQYRIRNLTAIGTKICNYYNLPPVHIYIQFYNDGSLSHYNLVHPFHIYYHHYNIEIGRDELDSMSFDVIIDSMIHEIGHNFARQIIVKHHLCKYFWALSNDNYIALRIYIIGLLVTWIPYGWILDIILILYLIIGFHKMNHDKKYEETYNHWKEIVADEFALSWTHNLHTSAEVFRQESSITIDELSPRQTVPLIDQITFQSPSAKHFIAKEKYRFLRAYSENWYGQKYNVSASHPSNADRMKHLKKFAKNGYKW